MKLAAALLATALAAPFSAPAPAADTERGRAVWNFRCYFCHGYSGDARTLAATFLTPPPRDFQSADATRFSLPRLRAAIVEGVPGTAMKSFRGILSDEDVEAVAAFLRSEFLEKRAANARYHTAANGWPGHERYRDAFAFARGEIALDADERSLDEAQRRGRRMFVSTCITCHDRSKVSGPGPTWEAATPR